MLLKVYLIFYLCVCLFYCALCGDNAHGGQKSVPVPLELELWMVISYCVGDTRVVNCQVISTAYINFTEKLSLKFCLPWVLCSGAAWQSIHARNSVSLALCLCAFGIEFVSVIWKLHSIGIFSFILEDYHSTTWFPNLFLFLHINPLKHPWLSVPGVISFLMSGS